MKIRILHFIKFLLPLLILLLSGCGGTTPTVINANLSASAQVNPDVSGRPSPIVIRTYELKSLGAFNEADFYSLFNTPESQLGSELINSVKFHLDPGQTKEFNQTTSPETKYFAVIAAYRMLDQAVWRDHAIVTIEKTTNLTIQIDKLNIQIIKK